MVNIDVKRFECDVCGTFFTSPPSINRITNEFTNFEEYRFLIPKEITNPDDTKRSITNEEKTQSLNDIKTKVEQIKNDWSLARTENMFNVTLPTETDEVTHWIESIKITLMMKEAIMITNDAPAMLQIILKCPTCDREAYRVNWSK